MVHSSSKKNDEHAVIDHHEQFFNHKISLHCIQNICQTPNSIKVPNADPCQASTMHHCLSSETAEEKVRRDRGNCT